MVHGLVHFSSKLNNFKDHYVLIGGVAGDLLMSEIGGEFRATKDLDIVVFMRPDPNFLKALSAYIKDGDYKNQEKSGGSAQYYRFSKPSKPEFPKQIELFSKKPEDLSLLDGQHIIPLEKSENENQFSGILLEDEYYDLIKNNLTKGEHCNFISALAQIPLKARAFNELRERKTQGVPIDDKDIRKHRNDILLLTQALPEGVNLKLSGLVLTHLNEYLGELQKISKDVGVIDFCKNKKLSSPDNLISLLTTVYL